MKTKHISVLMAGLLILVLSIGILMAPRSAYAGEEGRRNTAIAPGAFALGALLFSDHDRDHHHHHYYNYRDRDDYYWYGSPGYYYGSPGFYGWGGRGWGDRDDRWGRDRDDRGFHGWRR